MPEETTGNECPRCKQNTMRIIRYDDGRMNGICHNCGKSMSYTPPKQSGEYSQKNDIMQLFQKINEYAFLIAIVAMIFAISTMSSIGSVSDQSNMKINILNDQFIEKTNELNESLNISNNQITNHTSQISKNTLDIINVGSQLTSLLGIESDVSQIQSSIETFNSTLQTTTERVNELEIKKHYKENCTFELTIKEFPSQSTSLPTRYANICVRIKSNTNSTISFNETHFVIQYNDGNLSLDNFNTKYLPYTYQPLPEYLETRSFERTSEYIFDYNLTWNTSDYDTTYVSLSEFDSYLCVDCMYFDFVVSKE